MDDKANGHAQDATAPTPPLANPSANTLKAAIDPQVRQVVGVMVRGLLISAPGIPPAALLDSIARQVGYSLANAINGDVMGVLKLRGQFKKAFDEGVAEVKVAPPANRPPGN